MHLYDLEQKSQEIIIEQFMITAVSVIGEQIYWRQPSFLPDGGIPETDEIYFSNPQGNNIRRVTDNDWSEWCYTLRENVLYCWYEKTGEPDELRVLYADSGQDKIISQKINLAHSCIDGDDHYILFCEEDDQNRLKMMLYDEADGGMAKYIGNTDHVWAAIDDGVVYFSRIRDGEADLDIWMYDIKTGESRAVISEKYMQWYADVDENIMMYKYKDGTVGENPSNIYLYDLETEAARQFSPRVSEYSSLGKHGKYISFKHDGYNEETDSNEDHVYVCDLEEGGFIDSEGHVIAEDADGGE